jgi:regulator of Ty1 transposition protein 103
MRGFATNSNPTTPKDGTPKQETPGTPKEVDRPEMEALTPPSYEPLSPIRDAEPSTELEYAPPAHNVTSPPKTTAGLDLLASLSTGTYGGSGSGSMGGLNGHGNGSGIGSNKKRKIELDDFPDLGADGIDDDVAAMLREGR